MADRKDEDREDDGGREQLSALNSRNQAMLMALVGLAILFYLLSFVRMG